MTEKRVGWIRRLWRFVWRSITLARTLVANLIFLGLVALVVFVVLQDEKLALPESGVLVLAPTGQVVDQRSFVDPLSHLLDPGVLEAETPLYDMVDAVQQAAQDERIVGMLLDLDEMAAISVSNARELGRAVRDFRAEGKPVVAMGDNFNQQQYLLASYADEIYLHSLGAVSIQGFGVYPSYYRDLLERLEVDVYVFRVGEYKAAVEPFIRDSMSIEARQNNRGWLQSIWSNYSASVAVNRDLDPKSIDTYVNNYDLVLENVGGNAARGALDAGLIDEIMGREDMLHRLSQLAGLEAYESESTDEHMVHFYDYLNQGLGALPVDIPVEGDAVAVVVAEGMIVDGEQPPGVAGGDSIAGLLRSARNDEQIKAVVLRINSPGGSAFASEVIREQVLLTQQAGKPVVASMGSMAASGGYWIAAGAEEIWAQPTTITGSIGIFGVFPSIHRTLAKWGIHSDGVGTSRMADAFRVDRPLSDISSNAMQSVIDNGYQRFIQLVSESRGMSQDAVESVAQGRVWSGEDALAIGLVDSLGDLDDAIMAAADLAELEDYEAIWLSDQDWLDASLLQRFLEVSVRAVAHQAIALVPGSDALVESLGVARELPLFNDPAGAYLHCMDCAALR